MANPQLEDGYTMIANEILEALAKINLAPYESRILCFILRKTYGWHKKGDLITLSQIVAGTGIAKGHVSRALKHLITRNIVTRIGNKWLGFQKDYEKWRQKLPEQVTREKLPEQLTGVTIGGTPSTTKKLPAGEPQNIYKETTTKEKGILPSKDQKALFKILRRCPAIKESDACKLPELLEDYPNVNHALEFKKFVEWWPGPKRRTKPWAVLRNWLERAPKQVPELVDSGHYRDLSKVKE